MRKERKKLEHLETLKTQGIAKHQEKGCFLLWCSKYSDSMNIQLSTAKDFFFNFIMELFKHKSREKHMKNPVDYPPDPNFKKKHLAPFPVPTPGLLWS